MQDQPSDNIDLSKLGTVNQQDSVTYNPDPSVSLSSINDALPAAEELKPSGPGNTATVDPALVAGITMDLSNPSQIPGQVISVPQNSHPDGLNILNPPTA